MADLIIKGMEMPIKNGCTMLTIWPNGTVNAAVYTQGGRSASFYTKTAVPLPEGHGRLIDADALAYSAGVRKKGCAYQEEIFNAPTIVPAEGGSDDEHV